MKSIPPASQASFGPGLATRRGTVSAIVLLLLAGCTTNDTHVGGSGGVGPTTGGAGSSGAHADASSATTDGSRGSGTGGGSGGMTGPATGSGGSGTGASGSGGAGAGTGGAPVTCTGAQTNCGGACVDMQSDAKNCADYQSYAATPSAIKRTSLLTKSSACPKNISVKKVVAEFSFWITSISTCWGVGKLIVDRKNWLTISGGISGTTH